MKIFIFLNGNLVSFCRICNRYFLHIDKKVTYRLARIPITGKSRLFCLIIRCIIIISCNQIKNIVSVLFSKRNITSKISICTDFRPAVKAHIRHRYPYIHLVIIRIIGIFQLDDIHAFFFKVQRYPIFVVILRNRSIFCWISIRNDRTVFFMRLINFQLIRSYFLLITTVCINDTKASLCSVKITAHANIPCCTILDSGHITILITFQLGNHTKSCSLKMNTKLNLLFKHIPGILAHMTRDFKRKRLTRYRTFRASDLIFILLTGKLLNR